MSKLKQVTITLNAGSRESYGFKGNYLRLVTSLAGVNIKTENDDDFNIQNGNDVVFEDTDFYRIELTSLSGVTEAITIMVGENVKFSAPTVSGAVSILGTPTVIVSNQTSLSRSYTDSFRPAIAGKAANSVTEIFSPAFNTNGVEIINISAVITSGSGYLSTLIKAHTAAPASINDGIDIASNDLISGLTTGNIVLKDITIPAGRGLYLWNVNLLSADANVCRLCALVKKL